MNLWKEVHAILRARAKAGGIKHMKLMVSFSTVLGRYLSTR